MREGLAVSDMEVYITRNSSGIIKMMIVAAPNGRISRRVDHNQYQI